VSTTNSVELSLGIKLHRLLVQITNFKQQLKSMVEGFIRIWIVRVYQFESLGAVKLVFRKFSIVSCKLEL